MTAKKRIRIVSDGRTGGGTQVFIDGEDVSNSLAHVAWSIGANEMSRATLTFFPAELEVEFTAAVEEGEWRSRHSDKPTTDLDAPDEPKVCVHCAAPLPSGVERQEEV
jgi:hypothetical protein